MINHHSNPLPIFWTIWFALLLSVFAYQYVLEGGLPSGENQANPDLMLQALSVGVILIASVIRWIAIPKVKHLQHILVLMIIGLVLTESAQLFQLLLIGPEYPETQMFIFVLCLLSVGQFAPIYVKRS